MFKEFDGLKYECFENGTCVVYKYIDKRQSYDIPSKLPSGEIVTKIGDAAFYDCSNLASINIPKGVIEIGDNAFSHCSSLASINIPEGVTEIGDLTFYNCSSLRSINIPEGITKIGYHTFSHCPNLASINIPESVTMIDDYAFCDCFKLIKRGFFKATWRNMCCRDFQYELEKTYETSEAKLCECGFHYCENAFDLFNYYSGKIGEEVRFFKVLPEEILEERESDSKRVCKKITFLEEIKSYHDLLN